MSLHASRCIGSASRCMNNNQAKTNILARWFSQLLKARACKWRLDWLASRLKQLRQLIVPQHQTYITVALTLCASTLLAIIPRMRTCITNAHRKHTKVWNNQHHSMTCLTCEEITSWLSLMSWRIWYSAMPAQIPKPVRKEPAARHNVRVFRHSQVRRTHTHKTHTLTHTHTHTHTDQ